jgi:MAP3K TRAFs-binding domain
MSNGPIIKASSPVAQDAPTIEHESVINAVIIVVSNEVAAGKPGPLNSGLGGEVAMPIPRPVCFMIMPYGRKPTQAEAGYGPAEIDFNALWDRGYVPVIQALGYHPVRADQDTGALVITQMLERLYFADLVLADMTIANVNVYYEVGIRHAAKEKGCVLLAAEWSRQLFDVAQMRTVRYPLPEGMVTEQTAQAFCSAVKDEIQKRAAGASPMHESIHGYPSNVDEQAASTMKDQMTQLAIFQADLRTVRTVPLPARMARAQELVATYSIPMLPTVALALLLLLRASVYKSDDWKIVIDFIDKLPDELTTLAQVREQLAFARSHTGKHLEAIAEIDALIQEFGPTPERLGLLGGRFKRLYELATPPQEQLIYLNKTIESYERGMELDLNEYYCSSNLPRLYRKRNRKGDQDRARAVLNIVMAACDRAKRRGTSDEWLRPTLLAGAFDLGDADKAEELCDEVADEGPALWQIDSIVHDLEGSAAQVEDEDRRKRLNRVITRLKAY